MSQDVRQLLVLDLDETLIFATETPLNRSADFLIDRFHVYKRPFVDEFSASGPPFVRARGVDLFVSLLCESGCARALSLS
jgi:hypothetical protein